MEVHVCHHSTGATCTVELDESETVGTLKKKAVDKLRADGEVLQTDALGLRLKGTTTWLGEDDTPVEGTAADAGCTLLLLPAYEDLPHSTAFGAATGGTPFSDVAAGPCGRIVKIGIVSSIALKGISVTYANGMHFGHGWSTGYTTITLDEDEYITGVRGTSGMMVHQLSFVTNKQVHGPHGMQRGEPFSVDFPPGTELRYFFGRSTRATISRIGFAYGMAPEVRHVRMHRSPTYGLSTMAELNFDDCAQALQCGRLCSIAVRSGGVVHAIGAGYEDGTYLHHGGTGGKLDVISLREGERVVAVNMTCGYNINSITFTTTLRDYGPYGGQGLGYPVFVPFGPDEELVYFYGNETRSVDKIGFGYGCPTPLGGEPERAVVGDAIQRQASQTARLHSRGQQPSGVRDAGCGCAVS